MTRRSIACVAIVCATVAQIACGAGQEASKPAAPPRTRAGDAGSTKYSPLDQISSQNVQQLRIAWRHAAVDPAITQAFPSLRPLNNLRSTPLFVNGVLYASNGLGFVEAMDPATGRTIWTQEPLATGVEALQGVSGRGVAYWSDGAEERILTVRGRYLFALDPKSGRPIANFGTGGAVDLVAGLRASRFGWTAPVVVGDVVVVGGQGRNETPGEEGIPPGDGRGYDARTGALRWTFHVIPREGEFGIDTWKDDSWKTTGSAKVWSMVSADEELGYIYAPLSSAANDWYGGHRKGDNRRPLSARS